MLRCNQGRLPSRDSRPNGLETRESYRVLYVGLVNRFAWVGWRAGVATCRLVR